MDIAIAYRHCHSMDFSHLLRPYTIHGPNKRASINFNTYEAKTATSMEKACKAGSHARLILARAQCHEYSFIPDMISARSTAWWLVAHTNGSEHILALPCMTDTPGEKCVVHFATGDVSKSRRPYVQISKPGLPLSGDKGQLRDRGGEGEEHHIITPCQVHYYTPHGSHVKRA